MLGSQYDDVIVGTALRRRPRGQQGRRPCCRAAAATTASTSTPGLLLPRRPRRGPEERRRGRRQHPGQRWRRRARRRRRATTSSTSRATALGDEHAWRDRRRRPARVVRRGRRTGSSTRGDGVDLLEVDEVGLRRPGRCPAGRGRRNGPGPQLGGHRTSVLTVTGVERWKPSAEQPVVFLGQRRARTGWTRRIDEPLHGPDLRRRRRRQGLRRPRHDRRRRGDRQDRRAAGSRTAASTASRSRRCEIAG